MSHFALIIAGTHINSECNKAHNQVYTGLTCIPKCKPCFPAFVKPIQLKGKCNTFIFRWWNIGKTVPAKMVIVDSSRNLISTLPLENNTPYYFAFPHKDKYYILKLIEGSFVFADENPDHNSVYLEVVGDDILKTNDVRTREFLRVGDNFLVDQLACNLNCKKIYLSVYEKKCHTPNPNINEYLVKPKCWPGCSGKKCNETDGCGRICGCPNGKICNTLTGECVNPPPMPICKSNSFCGDGNGRCEGSCPPGSFCKRDINGKARCVSEGLNPLIIGLIIVIIILILFALVFGILSINDLIWSKC